MKYPLKVKAVLFKDYKDMCLNLPNGMVINGYYDRGALIFYSNNVCYTIPFIDNYADIEVIT